MAWEVSPSASRAWRWAELVEQLLEPQLVDLVDDDEQQLVVLVRAWSLGAEHLVEREVAAVGEGWMPRRVVGHDRPASSAATASWAVVTQCRFGS